MKRWSITAAIGLSIGAAVLAISAVSLSHAGGAQHVAGRSIAATPQKTARLADSALDPQTQPESQFVSITPCRIIDTRSAGGPLQRLVPRSFFVGGTTGFSGQGGQSGGCGIPTNATAIAGTVAVVGPHSNGYLKAFPTGSPIPNSVVLNFVKLSGALSTGATQAIAPTQPKPLSLSILGSPVNAVVDVSGYYIPQIQALIGGDGSVDAGTPRIVSVLHSGTGFYSITLDRPARQCAPSAATFNLDRYASVGLSSSSTPNVITVAVWHLDSTTHAETPEDYPFFLQVSC